MRDYQAYDPRSFERGFIDPIPTIDPIISDIPIDENGTVDEREYRATTREGEENPLISYNDDFVHVVREIVAAKSSKTVSTEPKKIEIAVLAISILFLLLTIKKLSNGSN